MRSVEYVAARLQATRRAQSNVAAHWIWPERTVEGWDHAIDQLARAISGREAASRELQTQSSRANAEITALTRMGRDVIRLGRTRFRANPAKLSLFKELRIAAASRNQARDEARKVRHAWQTADALWEPLPGLTAEQFNSKLACVESALAAHSVAQVNYREAAAQVMALARRLSEDCVAWYSDATVRFPASTAEGAMIRSLVPTYSGASRQIRRSQEPLELAAKAA